MIDEKKLIAEIREKIRPESFGEQCNSLDVIYAMLQLIDEQPKVGEWIPCSERLPENAKHRGAFCPKYQVKTKYGILAALRNDVSDWLVRHRDNWTAGDWEKLYEAVVREQEKRKKSNGRNNIKGNNSPAL